MNAVFTRRLGIIGAESIAENQVASRRISRLVRGAFSRSFLPKQSGSLAKRIGLLPSFISPNIPNLRRTIPIMILTPQP